MREGCSPHSSALEATCSEKYFRLIKSLLIDDLNTESLSQATFVMHLWRAVEGIEPRGTQAAGGRAVHEIQSSCRSRAGKGWRCHPVGVKLSGLKVGEVSLMQHWWGILHLPVLAS